MTTSCSRKNSEDTDAQGSNIRPFPSDAFPISDLIVERGPASEDPGRPERPSNRSAYFGDLHVHTTLSFDAFIFGTTLRPRDAYRYARGEAIQHPAGFDMQLREPLDFYAVTDHALFLGIGAESGDTSSDFSKLDVAEPLHDLNAEGTNRGPIAVLLRLRLFGSWVRDFFQGYVAGSVDRELATRVSRSAWQEIVEAADEANDPGAFTTFVAFEYTSSEPSGGSLHRNVIFRSSQRVPVEPFSRYNSRNPEGLWDWMDGLRARGVEALAIPHNSNLSDGHMFELADWAGDLFDNDYAEQRIRNEPLVEITQVKGTSETHPGLSDTDEWANFEINSAGANAPTTTDPNGSYVRRALRQGLALEDAGIVNPYKLGFVAASDTHVGATTDDESNYHSKLGLLDGTPELRGATPLPWWMAQPLKWLRPKMVTQVEGRNYAQVPTRNFGASGLAGVWAEENTRDSIYRAFRRKETFATSGPRIRVRFFAGHDLDESLVDDAQAIRSAYESGVTMGGELQSGGPDSPHFFAQAARDPLSAPLQRLQIVKGWVADGQTFERVYDIACSDGNKPDDETRRCPDNRARVDLTDCSYTPGVGADQLIAVWRDPDFDPKHRSFYYVRALENPTCRWSTWDALRVGVDPRPDLETTLQERAWSSPIWYAP